MKKQTFRGNTRYILEDEDTGFVKFTRISKTAKDEVVTVWFPTELLLAFVEQRFKDKLSRLVDKLLAE